MLDNFSPTLEIQPEKVHAASLTVQLNTLAALEVIITQLVNLSAQIQNNGKITASHDYAQTFQSFQTSIVSSLLKLYGKDAQSSVSPDS